MNLNENIHRIHQMMGIVSEEVSPNTAKKIIDMLGVGDAIKYLGGFDNFKKHLNFVYNRKSGEWVHASELQASRLETKPVDLSGILTREDKIKFIEDTINNEFEGLYTYGDEGWDEDDYSVLESTETYEKVVFTYYTDELDVTTFYRDENGEFSPQTENYDQEETIKYEDLPDDMIDKVFEFIAKRI